MATSPFSNVAPGVYSSTIDNSFYQDAPSVRTLQALFPIASKRGPDNKIKQFLSSPQQAILAEYGQPNFNKYGQSYLNALQWAEQGYETAICRLMPSDATYANVVFSYKKYNEVLTKVKDAFTFDALSPSKTLDVNSIDKFEVDQVVNINGVNYTVASFADNSENGGSITVTFKEDIAADIAKDVDIKIKRKEIVATSIEGATSTDAFDNAMKVKLDPAKEDQEVPFLILFPQGRGVDYNKISVQFVKSTDLEETYPDFAVYTMRGWDQTDRGVNTVLSEEDYQISFYPDAKDVNEMSLALNDILNDYSSFFQYRFDPSKVKQIICDMYNLDITSTPDFEIYSKDIFQDNIKFEDVNYNRFKNGSDGSLWTKEGELNWGSDDEVETGENTCFTNLLKNFFLCSIDENLKDRRWAPAKYVFDANYPLAVKQAMSTLTSSLRDDIRAIIDTGFFTKEEGELNWRKNRFNVDNCNVAIYPNNGYTIDKYTGKTIKVTSSYNVCKLYAKVKNNYGPHYVVGGFNEKGLMDEMISDKMAYSPALEYRNQFTKAQLNTIIVDPDGVFVMENITAQKRASALQQNHIADTLQIIRKETEDFCRKYILNLRLTDEGLEAVQGEIAGELQKWVKNGACEDIKVSVVANAMDRAKQRARAKISLKFVNIAKQIFLEFVVEGQGQ